MSNKLSNTPPLLHFVKNITKKSCSNKFSSSNCKFAISDSLPQRITVPLYPHYLTISLQYYIIHPNIRIKKLFKWKRRIKCEEVSLKNWIIMYKRDIFSPNVDEKKKRTIGKALLNVLGCLFFLLNIEIFH